MDGPIRVQSSQRKSKVAVRKNFSECTLPPMKALLQSEKELCTLSTEELKEEQDNFNEVTFLCFEDDTAAVSKELAAISGELPDLLQSLHLCTLHENEVIFLKDLHKPMETIDSPEKKNYPTRILCAMRLSPSFPRLGTDSVFTLLNKYTVGIRCTMEMYSLQKHLSDLPHTEEDDTNQSVSSIEDDFVTALEHLDEDEPTKMIKSGQVAAEKRQDVTSQITSDNPLESVDEKIVLNSWHWKPSVKSSFVNILELKELPSPVRNSVTTSISDPWIQRSFFRSRNPDHSTNFLHKTLFSSSPAESSESDCSSPSPVIFLDEEGYQKSMKAKLQLPKIPVMKDGIEDSDSEVSEFFDSFDQFDEQEQTLESGSKHARNPVMGNASENKIISYKKSRSARITMNPQKFKFDRLVLPANVRKPTPRKPKSPYSNLLDIPDSPHPVKTPGDDSRCLFSPIRSSAFSPLGSCFSTECLCQTGIKEDGVIQNHNLSCHTYSEFANNFSFEILSSVFNSQSSSVCKCAQDKSNSNTSVSKEEKHWTRKGQNKEGTSKSKSLMVKDHIQKFASELVEKSFGHAFQDLQKGVSTCTNALCHLAAKLTSLVFQMAFYEIGRQQALSLKKRAVNGLAGLLVSEAITGALKELQSVKQQIFTNTVAKFAAGLAEELIFEGIMEVCQFSYPSTPATCQNGYFHYNDNAVQLYAKDLSESVIQEAFIELSQVDVTFTTQAAISISVENIKYVSAASTSESTELSNASTAFQDNFPLTLIPVQEYRKEYTVHKALLYTSSIASSIPVPIAGSILSQNQILYADLRVKNHSTPDSNIKCCKESQELDCSTKKRQGEVTSVRNIYLTTDNSPDSECNAQILYKQSDFKQASNPEAPKFADLTGTPNVSSFSGTMVDMIVSEAYEAVTSSKVSKSARQYTNKLKMEKMPYLQCIGEDTCKNMFANYLSKRIVKHSADETRSACSATSEKLAYCVGLGSNAKSRKNELPGSIKQSEKTKTVPVIVGQQQMPLNSSSKFHGNPVYSSKFVLSGSKDCVQEKKKLVACRPSTRKSSPASAVNFVKHMEELPDPEGCSAKPISHPLSTCNMYNTSGNLTLGPERALDADTCNSVTSSCEDTFQIEEKSTSVRDGSLCGVPNTPPPTPLMPSQASSEWNLRKLTKKLKGELAKEFAPATPPSTPYRSEGDGLYGHESHDLGKEEFMLKLMRSLSEEVESSEDEENSATVVERIKLSVRTAEYADRLAASIISMATEKAASNLDKAVQMENYKYSPVNIESKRCHYTTFMNVPEKNIHSLWVYAGDMAGKLIREAKKMVESRHCNAQKLKQVTYQANGYHRKRRYHECWAKDRLKDRECFTLSLPTSLEAPGLTSKYPSCESVTDEYADHIIQILKREGGHSELIMDQFASRLAYRSIKSGMQQAARKLRIRYNRKIASTLSSKLSRKLELFEIANNNVDIKKYKKGNCHQFEKQSCGNKYGNHRTECSRLIDFSESLACNITSDVRRKLMSAACLPKSLTDSCLYEKSEVDEISDFKTPFSRMLSPLFCKQKLYHSTGSLNEPTNRDDIINAIEQYAGKVVDDTLGLSLESAALHTSEKWTNGDRPTYAEKLSPFSATACTYCSMREHQYCTDSSYLHLAGQERRSKFQQITNASERATCPKSNVLHLDIPKIHIDMDDKVIFADSMVAAAFDKAGRQLSNTSLTADSGIGQDGVSFAESLTTEILTSCMTRIGPAVKISSMGKEGFNSAESIVSQQMSLSNGDDSTGSWSNLSFEDEHPDENSSFLHLSDSNGNSSSWSSLGLEGDMYEENLSFPASDSDGTEEKEDDLKDNIGGLGSAKRTLVIINLDIGSHMMDSQLRMALQWLIASETDVAELHFHNDAPKEFVILSKRLQERGWKVGDLFQAVLKYCDVLEKADGERALENRTFFGWLQEHV